MGFNLKVLLHVSGILLNICLLSWCLLNTSYYATMLTLVLILALQVGGLLRYVSNTNRELTRFLSAVKYADFSQSFRGNRSHSSFRELGEAFDSVIARFRAERSDKEIQAAYLQAFVQQLPIAVFALQEDGRIAIANQALLKLLGKHACHHLDHIRAFDATLGDFLATLQPGRDQNLKLRRGTDAHDLKISCTLLRQRGQQQKLISILDISSELETRELQAWQNLIRVMTHEIMNSITPITSLADTANHYIVEASERLEITARQDSTSTALEISALTGMTPSENALHGTPEAESVTSGASEAESAMPGASEAESMEIRALLADAASATTTIGKRGQGLLRFVQSYRTLSRLPAPHPANFRVKQLLQSVVALMAEQASSQGTVLAVSCQPETLQLHADPELLEQALINLVRNALDAVSDVQDPVIGLTAALRERGQVVVTVSDNGCGIDAANLDNIFVPFYTTKRGGNGIGMTIVRQIVTVNGGVIRVSSHLGQGTAVMLTF